MRIIETKDVMAIRPLYDDWAAIANGQKFGLDIDIEYADANLQKLLLAGGTLLVAYDADQPVGFFSISPMQSFFGRQTFAMETMWFALPSSPRAGLLLFKEAIKWTESHGCSHLMLSGSWLASGMHDAVCRFCEKVGAVQFETVYLLKIDDNLEIK